MTSKQARGTGVATQLQGVARVRRNFWLLVAAAVIAVGMLSQALRGPNNPGSAAIVAVSGLAAIVSLALAGRILTVLTAHRRRSTGRQRIRRR